MEADFPWERKAMRGDPTPEGLSLIDQKAYQTLSCLYGRYRAGLISREDGSAEKRVILSAWRRESDYAEFDRKLLNFHAELRREIEGAQNRYRKERTLENADRLSQVLDGILAGGLPERGGAADS